MNANSQLVFDYEPHLVDIIVTAAIEQRANPVRNCYDEKRNSNLDENPARSGISNGAKGGEQGAVLFDEYHRLADQIYLLPLAQRENGVQNLQAYYFIKLGLRDAFERTFYEMRSWEWGMRNEGCLPSTVMVSPSDKEEGCFFNKGKNGILVKIRPARFADPDSMTRLLRHELMHLADVLDPAFKYPAEGEAAIEDAILLSRYALLWNMSVDSRLTRQGRETERGMEYYKKEFDAQFRKFSVDERGKIFEHLWNGKRPVRNISDKNLNDENLIDKKFNGDFQMARPTHLELIEWAKDPSLLLRMWNAEWGMQNEWGKTPQSEFCNPQSPRPLPGSPCPLCRFPSYDWIFGDKISDGVASDIRKDFPKWSKGDGACERCVEVYEVSPVRNFSDGRTVPNSGEKLTIQDISNGVRGELRVGS